jgi:hypothetical protein
MIPRSANIPVVTSGGSGRSAPEMSRKQSKIRAYTPLVVTRFSFFFA